jgi:hypothetical protein
VLLSRSKRLKEALIKIGFRELQPKNRIADILSASGEARSRLAERIFRKVIRAVRSGGQDVRDPFLKIKSILRGLAGN